MNRQVEQQILNFAQEVAPLYKYHNWLGLNVEPLGTVKDRVAKITKDLYKLVEDQALIEPDEDQSASTGRVIVWYDAGGPDDIGVIRFGLDLIAVYYDEGTRSFIT